MRECFVERACKRTGRLQGCTMCMVGAGKAPLVGIEDRTRCREASLQPTFNVEFDKH